MEQLGLNPLAVEVTNRCNMKCLMCVSHGAALYEGQADGHPPFMDVEFFKSIVDQYVAMEPGQQKGVVPQFQGEPMLHPRFLELCEYLEKKKVTFGFTTNASVLKPEISRELLKFIWFNNVTFSLDGLSKETYTQIRVGANYEKVMANIDDFLSLSQESRYKVRTTISLTEQPMNEHEVADFVKHWAHKADCVSINNVAVHGRPAKLRWTPERIACGDLWHFMIVLTNGQVVPCCRDYTYKLDVGNLREQSLESIWHGPKYESLRRLHLEGKWGQIPLCNDCDTWMCRTSRRDVEYVDDGKIKVTHGPFFRIAEPVTVPSESRLDWDWADEAKWRIQDKGVSVAKVNGGLELTTNGNGIAYQIAAEVPSVRRNRRYICAGRIGFERQGTIRVGILAMDGSRFLALHEPSGSGKINFNFPFFCDGEEGIKVVFCNNQIPSQKVTIHDIAVCSHLHWDRLQALDADTVGQILKRETVEVRQ